MMSCADNESDVVLNHENRGTTRDTATSFLDGKSEAIIPDDDQTPTGSMQVPMGQRLFPFPPLKNEHTQHQAETDASGGSGTSMDSSYGTKSQISGKDARPIGPDYSNDNDVVLRLGGPRRRLLKRLMDAQDNMDDLVELVQGVQLPGNLGDRAEVGQANGQTGGWGSFFMTLSERCHASKRLKCLRLAVALTPDDHPDMVNRLDRLGSACRVRFEAFGWSEDINIAVDCYSYIITLLPDGHPEKPRAMSYLGVACHSRFEVLGGHNDINRAVDCHSQAVALTSEGDLDKSIRLGNLGGACLSLFKAYGRHDDIKKAIECLNLSVTLLPEGHSDKARSLNNLGNAYQSLFQISRRYDDIEKSVECHSQAIIFAPDGHPQQPDWLGSLGNAYLSLYEASGKRDAIEKSVDCLDQAVALTTTGFAHQPFLLHSLGAACFLLFKELSRPDDLDKAINYLSQAVELTPDYHPDKPGWLINLGDACISLSVLSVSCERTMRPLYIFKDAALMVTGRPSIRLIASRKWAKFSQPDQTLSLEAHTRCMQLLSEAVWLGGSIHDRYVWLEVNARNLVAEAAAAAIMMHQYDTALEWLEHGRCIVWTQLLELRSPLDELHDAHPETTESFQRLSKTLEHSPMSSSDEATLDVAQRHRLAAIHREEFIKEIRRFAGFEDFLQPLKAAKLASYVCVDAAVFVNVSPERCDALVIQSSIGRIEHVPLPDLTYEQAIAARTELIGQMHSRGDERGIVWHMEKPKIPVNEVLHLLWCSVAQPVLAHLNISHVLPVDQLPHTAWCVTGPLSFLPIHAAGDYTSGRPDTVLHNLAVSSYIPNLSVLARSTEATPHFSGMLAVGVATPNRDSTPLVEVKRELSQVQRLFADRRCSRLDDASASTDIVLRAMADHSWVHFACHASQNSKNPLESAFKLFGADLDLAAISRTRLPHADFAFLSACQTATGDNRVPDETVHLAAGLLMAGYRSVIASMWTIYDKHAPVVAETVYECMIEGDQPDSRRAARALHMATGRLRELVGVEKYDVWVPYIHMGY